MRPQKVQTKPRVLWSGGLTVSTRPWPNDSTWAHLLVSGAHSPGAHLPDQAIVAGWWGDLADCGYVGVRTGAVAPDIADDLKVSGFRTIQTLRLLSADLTSRPNPAGGNSQFRPGRGRFLQVPRLMNRILEIDAVSFGQRWSLDRTTFHDAARATRRSRLFTARSVAGVPIGFVLVGITGTSGFIQRLAVAPECRRDGFATDLMDAAHRWLRSHRCTTATVNTESTNVAALRLYERFGYAELPYGLQVLERPLSSRVATL